MNWVERIRDGELAYLDANIVIYAVEGAQPHADSIRAFFERAD